MTVVNEIVRLESAVPPAELLAFQQPYPHILRALEMQQTLINQLIIRVGGSGPGTGVADLDALTDRVEVTESDIVEIDEITDPSSPALFHAEHALNAADQAMIMASSNDQSAQIADLRSRVEAIEYYAGDVQLIAQIADLRSRIEALENVSNA